MSKLRWTQAISSRRVFYGLYGVVVALGLGFVLFRAELLPERFDGDARSIAAAADAVKEDASAQYIDAYYTNAGRVYGWLGVADKPEIVGVVGYLLVAGLGMVVLWRWRGRSNLDGWGGLALAGVVLGLSAVYLGTLSKDIFGVILVVGPLTVGARHKWGLAAGSAGAILFGLVFRPYFVVVAVVGLAYYVIMRLWQPRVWQWAGIVAMSVVAGVVGYYLLTGVDISTVREVNNAGREAASILPNMMATGSVWSGIANSLIVGALVMLPLPLLVACGWYHFGAAMLVMGLLALGIWLLREANLKKAVSAGLSMIMALFTVQCLFEPDLGSVLRHWTMLGILMLVAYCTVRGKYEQA